MLKLTLLFPLLLISIAAGQTRDVSATILAMERAALDRSDKLDVNGFLEISDAGVVYIDPALEQPIVGLENLRAYYAKFQGQGTPSAGEMVNSKVQVAGDTAVLTFNYRRKDGKAPRWNTTEVYRKTKAGWRIIHTHWSYIKPQPPK